MKNTCSKNTLWSCFKVQVFTVTFKTTGESKKCERFGCHTRPTGHGPRSLRVARRGVSSDRELP